LTCSSGRYGQTVKLTAAGSGGLLVQSGALADWYTGSDVQVPHRTTIYDESTPASGSEYPLLAINGAYASCIPNLFDDPPTELSARNAEASDAYLDDYLPIIGQVEARYTIKQASGGYQRVDSGGAVSYVTIGSSGGGHKITSSIFYGCSGAVTIKITDDR